MYSLMVVPVEWPVLAAALKIESPPTGEFCDGTFA
jgi:hypothetical protein